MAEPHSAPIGPPSKEGDPYTATYMPGAGRVILRDKIVSRALVVILGLFAVWCGGGAVASFVAMPTSGPGVTLAIATLLFGFLATTLTVVRSVVSASEVHVQYGLWGPRVPIEAITSCRVVAFDWKKFGGWGIKRSSDGTWAYVLKSGGFVVELVWTNEDGDEKKAVFSASDPQAVVAAIERSRAAAARVRVAAAGPLVSLAPADEMRVASPPGAEAVEAPEEVEVPAAERQHRS